VFENRVLRRIFRRMKCKESWRMLHIEELHKLYSPPSIIRMIKPRRMRHMRKRGMHITCNLIPNPNLIFIVRKCPKA
jgi:hypothetical protein